jgi:lysine/ornithine N-monooxygenase
VASDEILNELQTRFAEIAPHILDYNYTVPDEQKQAVAQSIQQFYFQGKAISTETVSNIIQVSYTGKHHKQDILLIQTAPSYRLNWQCSSLVLERFKFLLHVTRYND